MGNNSDENPGLNRSLQCTCCLTPSAVDCSGCHQRCCFKPCKRRTIMCIYSEVPWMGHLYAACGTTRIYKQTQQLPAEGQNRLPETCPLGKPHKEQWLQIKDTTASFSVKSSKMLYCYMHARGGYFPSVRCTYLL